MNKHSVETQQLQKVELLSIYISQNTQGNVCMYNSDIMKLVKYLFLTAGLFQDNWANPSTNAVLPTEVENQGRRLACHLPKWDISIFMFGLVLEEVYLKPLRLTWAEIYCPFVSITESSILILISKASVLEWHKVNWM